MQKTSYTIAYPRRKLARGIARVLGRLVLRLAFRIEISGQEDFEYGPLLCGHLDRPAMRKALDILARGEVIGVFPEGGIWEAGAMRPQTGIAWLSYRGRTPVLPMDFAGTLGALQEWM